MLYSNSSQLMVNVLKFQTFYSIRFVLTFAFFAVSFLEMANSVDPDQTALSGAR